MLNDFFPSLQDLANLQKIRRPTLQALHDALAAVRSRGAYYGGAPQVPGPAVRPAMPVIREPPLFDFAEGRGPIRSVGGTPTWAGRQTFPLATQSNENVTSANPRNMFYAERQQVLAKLIANRDWKPIIQNGRMWFRSLTPRENEIMARIGWARAPEVELEQEMSSDPLTMRRAWERNIRHWLELASPAKE